MRKNSCKIVAVLLAITVFLVCSVTSVFAFDGDFAGSVIPDDIKEMMESSEETTPTETETQTETESDEPVLGKMTEVKKDSQNPTSMHIYWAAVINADGYNVYLRNVTKKESFSLYKSITAKECNITGLSSAYSFEVRVRPYRVRKDQTIDEGDENTLQTATNPTKIKNEPDLQRSSTLIEFDWDKVDRATGYQIYRMYYKTKEYTLYKTVKGANNTTLSDTNVEQGRGYFYKVRAYYTDWGRMYYGEFSPALQTTAGLCNPGVKKITSQLWRCSLVWNENKYAEGYDLYCSSTSSSSGFKYIGTTSKTFWNTVRMTSGKRYYFRIVPYKYVGDVRVTGTWATANIVNTYEAYGDDCGTTYIEISIEQQMMWYYVNGDLYVETPVVTGNYNSMDTPKGHFYIQYKTTGAYLMGNAYVDYWMPFYMGCGIHDSSWRDSYGGTIYKGNGSHGCVNTPYSAVKKIYNKAPSGEDVIVY